MPGFVDDRSKVELRQDLFSTAILFHVPRSVIERKDVAGAVSVLQHCSASEAAALKIAGRLAIEVCGYDFDERQLCQIPEVSAFFQALHGQWPCLPLLLEKDAEEFRLFASLVGDGRAIAGGIAFNDVPKLRRALFATMEGIGEYLVRVGAAEAGPLEMEAAKAVQLFTDVLDDSMPPLRVV